METSTLNNETVKSLSSLQNNRSGGYFPQRYLTDFFEFLKFHSNDIEIITYADMSWNGDCDYKNSYPEEFASWNSQIKSGKIDRKKAYILLQYDVDTNSESTMDLLRHSSHRDVPANIMIFNRRINRKLLRKTGVLEYTDYPLDYDYLQKLVEKEKFLVGYHSNAVEQGLWDMQKSEEFFRNDILALRKKFNIRYFSAHGGVASAEGINNYDLPLAKELYDELKWVHNKYTVRFKKSFSDGGHNSKSINPINRDLRDFVRKIQPGNRYRVLIHPQYYVPFPKVSQNYSGTPWYDQMLEDTVNPDTVSLWSNVKFG